MAESIYLTYHNQILFVTHKEERFLFPIYLLFAIGMAVVLDVVMDASRIWICSKLAQKYIHKNVNADISKTIYQSC